MTFWTFGVEHYELEENMVQYEKKEKVPNFIINKTCHMGHFSWDMRNVQKFDKFGHHVRNLNLDNMIKHLTKVKNILLIPKAYLKEEKNKLLR